MTESTTATTSADPPDNQGGGVAPSEPGTGSTQTSSEPDYTIASDPPDNQGA